jgi:hypothetical protein
LVGFVHIRGGNRQECPDSSGRIYAGVFTITSFAVCPREGFNQEIFQ